MGFLSHLFAATESELLAYYPGWKVPLAKPIRSPVRNPFTGETLEGMSWDPDPENPVEDPGPRRLPSPSINLEGLRQTSVISLIGVVHDSSLQAEDTFMRYALLGPGDGPWLNELTPAFVAKLVKLDDAGRDRVAEAWTAAEHANLAEIPDKRMRNRLLEEQDARYWRATLDKLADFSRKAVAQGRRVYMRTRF